MSAYQPSGIPGGSEPDNTTQDADSAAATTDWVSASTAAASSAAPGSLSLVVVPSCSVIVRLVRTGSSVGTQRNGTADGVQGGDQRIRGGRRQQCDGLHAGRRQCPRDVDALSAGLGGDRGDPVHRAARQRCGERDGPVDARVGRDGDDHATTTSTPCSVNCERSASVISESVIRVSTLDSGAKLTKSSRPTLEESATATT